MCVVGADFVLDVKHVVLIFRRRRSRTAHGRTIGELAMDRCPDVLGTQGLGDQVAVLTIRRSRRSRTRKGCHPCPNPSQSAKACVQHAAWRAHLSLAATTRCFSQRAPSMLARSARHKAPESSSPRRAILPSGAQSVGACTVADSGRAAVPPNRAGSPLRRSTTSRSTGDSPAL